MYNDYSNPTLTNCTFRSNSAVKGGGMHNDGSSPSLTNCEFEGNSAGRGGGMNNEASGPTLNNCTFRNNSASEGGGMRNVDFSSPTLNDCTLCSNSPPQISGVYTPPALRGRGIATVAMNEICEDLFERGFPRATLYVNRTNSAARSVYQKVGFQYHTDYQTVFIEPSG